MINEEYAYVLDYLPSNTPNEPDKAQLLGSSFFVLLEASLKKPVKTGEFVYIGKNEREQINRILRRINYTDLSSTSETELPIVIKEVIKKSEPRFLRFFNEARPLSLKRHQIELIPGIGKKTLETFLAEREKEHFKSLEEINTRISSFPDVLDSLSERIILEIKGEDAKYFLFVPKFVSLPQKPKKRRF